MKKKPAKTAKKKAVAISPMYLRVPIDWRKRLDQMANKSKLTMAQFIHGMLKPILEGTAVARLDKNGDVVEFEKRKRKSVTLSPDQCSKRGGAQPDTARAKKMLTFYKANGFEKTAKEFKCTVSSIRQLFYRHKFTI